MNNDSMKTTNSMLSEIANRLHDRWRPRLFFDIVPSKKGSFNLFDVVLKNVGGSPAHKISLRFNPDLPYSDTYLSNLPIFKNLDHLPQGEEISFFYESAIKFLNDLKFPKKSTVSIEYQDANQRNYSEEINVDLELYRNLHYIDEKGMSDLLRNLENIQRVLERIQRDGLLTKTMADLEAERARYAKSLKEKQKLKK